MNKTGSGIVGRNFRSYCSFGCSGGSSSEYVNLTVDSSAPAAPVDTSKAYRIAAAGGRVLAQVAGGSATTSIPTATGDGLEIVDLHRQRGRVAPDRERRHRAAPRRRLRHHGQPRLGHPADGHPVPGGRSHRGAAVVRDPRHLPTDGSPNGTYRLVNRYSGLVVGLSGTANRLAETTPTRSWTNTTANAVGARTAGEQTLTLTVVGQAPVVVADGDHAHRGWQGPGQPRAQHHGRHAAGHLDPERRRQPDLALHPRRQRLLPARQRRVGSLR
ncbi:hypothetical protein [Streptomyces narbonensis]